MNLILKQLDREKAGDVYERYMKNDFAPDELKPFEIICRLMNKGIYRCYGIYGEDKLFSYAFFVKPKGSGCMLLDYFAVTGELRGRGIGSASIGLIKAELSGPDAVILESEHIKYAKNQNDKKTRERRVEFYLRNGFIMSGVFSKVGGVEYHIMHMPLKKKLDDKGVFENLDLIYKEMFSQDCFKKNVIIMEQEVVK